MFVDVMKLKYQRATHEYSTKMKRTFVKILSNEEEQ